LVQKAFFKKELDVIRTKEQRLHEIEDLFSEIIESLSDEEKEGEFLNDEKTSFISSEVKKWLNHSLEISHFPKILSSIKSLKPTSYLMKRKHLEKN
jgi:type I restriction enzyme M protein